MSEKNKKIESLNLNAVSSREEAEKFDQLLVQYSKEFAKIEHPPFLSLANCWERIQKEEQAGRLFTSVFDIKLTLVLLNYDAVEISTSYNSMKKTSDAKLSIVNQPLNSFFARVDLHRSANAYILRYRAMFDKLMGLLILMHSPEDYNRFLKSRSGRKEFKKIVSNYPKIFPIESIDNLFKSITIFDNGYRTSEAHHAGKLRKYSFSFDPKETDYFGKLQLDSWNYLMEILRSIDKNIG
jgi:hypothetical protein